jgi:hypothetical protein
MKEVRAPAGPAPRAVRSFAACLATVLELPMDVVPCPEAGDPLIRWREWLAQRGLGLVLTAEGGGLNWAGPSIARVAAADGGDPPAIVRFGSPPGLVWDPLNRLGADSEEVIDVFLVAGLDPAVSWGHSAPAVGRGVVETLVIASDAEGPATSIAEAQLLRGRGMAGDRYARGEGTFSDPASSGHDLTLIAAEVLEELELKPEQARRNVVTRGVDLDALIGRRFWIGEVECYGQRRCEPCAHLQRLGPPGVLRALVHRGGLRADLLSSGSIRVGDSVKESG